MAQTENERGGTDTERERWHRERMRDVEHTEKEKGGTERGRKRWNRERERKRDREIER